MKKLFLLPLMIFTLISIQAKDLSDYDYVITKEATYYCQQINMGLIKTKCVLQNGETLDIKISEIIAYKANGRIFERMPVYQDDMRTGSDALMELISLRDGLKLFRHTSVDYTDVECSGYNQYFIFRNNDYVLQLSSKSGEQLLKFFKVAIK